MSTALLLDALRRHDLQEYYPSLSSNGIFKLDNLAELSEAEYSRIGVRSAEDRSKFLALARDMKNILRSNKSNNQNNDTAKSRSAEFIPKKRPLPTTKASPERKNRRMTIAPQSMISRTPPKPSARDRRLSYLPPSSRRESMFHRPPTHLQAKNASPQRPKALPKPKAMAEEYIISESQKETVIERPSARLLDAYGIPVSQKQRPISSSAVDTSATQHGSLEEFLLSKSKISSNSINKTSAHIATHTVTAPTTNNDLNQRIRVCVRKRPLNKKEISNQETDIAPLVGSRTIQLNAPKTRIDLTRYTEKHTFTFDDTFDGSSSNEQIYARTAQPLVEYVFKGGKATCFAHGQTGSGKTYTMLDPVHGLYVLAAQDIFRYLSSEEYSHLSASVGFYEIYQGHLLDLLNSKSRLTARDDGNGNVVIAGLREFPIKSVEDLLAVFEYGNQGRTTGKTGANNKSSRSHAVLQILLRTADTSSKVHGKLSFIDLAGSERGADRGDANTKTRLEGAEINKSLLALKECIRALDQNKIHTPFRGSKLTQVLRDSFTGDSRTCMIATISPNNSNSEHTLNTLRYADRVKQLRGESDPRLTGDYNITSESKVDLVTTNEDAEMRDTDSQSLANSDAIWEDEVSENLLDVDFPTEVTANALATPTNSRFFSSTESTTPQRQEKYLKRLESPPAEVFDQKMEDPFFSTPVVKTEVQQHMLEGNVDRSMQQLDISSAPVAGLDATRIRRFMRLHRAQIKEMEECIRNEKKMIGKLSLIVSSDQNLNDDNIEDQEIKEEYETYLNDLEEVMDRKFELVAAVKEKIREELEE